MIPKEQNHLSISAISHPGMSGKNNEDYYLVSSYQVSHSNKTPSVLVVLADGVGGHNAGEVAAKIASETITNIIAESDATRPLQTLETAIIEAGREVSRTATETHQYLGMGSTCACAWVIENRLYIGSVGDSRIYIIRNRSIQQLSTDHTWVQEAIEHGIIERSEAKDHPQAHVIRRYLGSQRNVIPDLRLRLREGETDEQALENQGLKLKTRDTLLLCSDGLTDLVDDNEILEILQNNTNEQAVNYLVALANERGGHDNITIVTIEMPASYNRHGMVTLTKSKEKRNRFRWFILLTISILTIFIIIFVTWLLRQELLPPIITQPQPAPTETLEITPLATEHLEGLSSTITPDLDPTKTSIKITYTPWPTHTYPPEP